MTKNDDHVDLIARYVALRLCLVVSDRDAPYRSKGEIFAEKRRVEKWKKELEEAKKDLIDAGLGSIVKK